MVEFFQSCDKNIQTKIRLVLKSRVHLFLGEAKVSVWCLGFFYLIHRIFRKCDPRILFWQIRVQGFFSCNVNKYNIRRTTYYYIYLFSICYKKMDWLMSGLVQVLLFRVGSGSGIKHSGMSPSGFGVSGPWIHTSLGPRGP